MKLTKYLRNFFRKNLEGEKLENEDNDYIVSNGLVRTNNFKIPKENYNLELSNNNHSFHEPLHQSSKVGLFIEINNEADDGFLDNTSQSITPKTPTTPKTPVFEFTQNFIKRSSFNENNEPSFVDFTDRISSIRAQSVLSLNASKGK